MRENPYELEWRDWTKDKSPEEIEELETRFWQLDSALSSFAFDYDSEALTNLQAWMEETYGERFGPPDPRGQPSWDPFESMYHIVMLLQEHPPSEQIKIIEEDLYQLILPHTIQKDLMAEMYGQMDEEE